MTAMTVVGEKEGGTADDVEVTVGVGFCFVVGVVDSDRGRIGRVVNRDTKANTIKHGTCTLTSNQQVNGQPT